jgi:hypothetical protein
MKLKILGLILLFASPCFAGNAESFATGFANALNRSMGGREYQSPSYNQEQVNVQVDTYVTPHYDAITQSGDLSGLYFATYGACRRYIANAPGWYGDCEYVTR